jgi:hypothetical protein
MDKECAVIGPITMTIEQLIQVLSTANSEKEALEQINKIRREQ